jgi:2-polyprenyl-6-methoxyphenol hydroxylase-like FAD-dependent oxidoreductase
MVERTGCVIIGGGPAGMVAGLILARCGVPVTVLEKHGDFLRDFRGDTVHPTTLDLLDELGLYQRFAAIPHSEISQVTIEGENGRTLRVADLSRLRLRHPFIAMAPQWDFLNVLADAGREEATFTLRMRAEVVALVREHGRVTGVRYRAPDGEHELRAELTIAADGRWSLTRRQADLPIKNYPVGIDVWWFRLPTDRDDIIESILPRASRGNLYVSIPRRGYVQTARLIPKGSDRRLRERGIEVFRTEIATAMPILAEAAEQLDFGDVKLLRVELNRLRRWYEPGLLCIGDAAHAMSPMGGVGVNLAVQDGVAAAARLAGPLLSGRVTQRQLRSVQRRRRLPTIATQALQRLMHRLIGPVVTGTAQFNPPASAERLLHRFPVLTAIPARLIAVGLRPEHAPAAARRSPLPVSRS